MCEKQCVMGIDLGTSTCKSMVFDLEGNVLGKSSLEYNLILTPAGIEQNAEMWWSCVCKTSADAAKQANERIAALALSTQGIAGVLADAQGIPLTNALSWLDKRSASIVEDLEERYSGQVLFQQTGKNPGVYALPQLMWLKEHKKQVFENAHKYFLTMDFLMYRMTGVSIMDYSMAGGTFAFDVSRKQWIESMMLQAGTHGMFSSVGCMGQPVGKLLKKAANELGLSEDTLVVLGGQDQKCAAIGAGVDSDSATISLGTSAALCTLVEEPIMDEQREVTCCGLDETHWILETFVETAGASLKWLRMIFSNQYTYAVMDRMAGCADVGAGGLLFFPYLSGEGGTEGMFRCVTLFTTKEDMIRAVMEGVAYVLDKQLQQHERLCGKKKYIRLFGGGAQGKAWRQIIANMTGKTVLTGKTHDAACLGAAILAARGKDWIADIYRPGKMRMETEKVVPTDEEDKEKYFIYKNRRQRYEHKIQF